MYYDKRIRYIDYLENGEKRRNCGNAKITVTGDRLLLEMQIKGLYATDDVASEVMLEGAGIESRIGTVIIHQGSGNFRWEKQDAAHQGEELLLSERLAYGDLERIAVHLSSRRSLYCIWREAGAIESTATRQVTEGIAQESKPPGDGQSRQEEAVRPEEDTEQKTSVKNAEQPEREGGLEREERPEQENIAETDKQSEQETTMRTEEQPEQENTVVTEEQPEWENTMRTEKQPEQKISVETEGQSGQKALEQPKQPQGLQTHTGPEPSLEQDVLSQTENPSGPQLTEQEELHTAETRHSLVKEPPAMPMSEDKWQQLERIYPHIRPFQDEREYLSLRPEDFVILHSNTYHLVQNSFLLHGFYNYKHLILTYVSQRNAQQYYIGVPGNFYEKEKQVAIMYGFSSFECKQEPAREGDFGYYMIRVEL
ncbi:MAG: hypothetical protein K2O34_00700 [Acetatifactor sp.]|nr:hypothetical protein [Acetatifactor sp.]